MSWSILAIPIRILNSRCLICKWRRYLHCVTTCYKSNLVTKVHLDVKHNVTTEHLINNSIQCLAASNLVWSNTFSCLAYDFDFRHFLIQRFLLKQPLSLDRSLKSPWLGVLTGWGRLTSNSCNLKYRLLTLQIIWLRFHNVWHAASSRLFDYPICNCVLCNLHWVQFL